MVRLWKWVGAGNAGEAGVVLLQCLPLMADWGGAAFSANKIVTFIILCLS